MLGLGKSAWFETLEIEGKRIPHAFSRFCRPDFVVSVDLVRRRWRWWTRRQKGLFAAAFSHRVKLVEGDCDLLDFLMENGNCDVWMTIAGLVAREYPDRNRALEFLLSLVRDRVFPLTNYYQALDILATREGSDFLQPSIPYLKEALAMHAHETQKYPSLKWWRFWRDTFAYGDYLGCSATLFKLTGDEEYRNNLSMHANHRDWLVRMMVRTAAKGGGMTPSISL